MIFGLPSYSSFHLSMLSSIRAILTTFFRLSSIGPKARFLITALTCRPSLCFVFRKSGVTGMINSSITQLTIPLSSKPMVHLSCTLTSFKSLNTTLILNWKPPPQGDFKLNTNGSCLVNPGIGGTGGVIRNSNGNWVVGFHKGYASTTNNHMELLALLEGLKLAEQHNLIPIEINVDSVQII